MEQFWMDRTNYLEEILEEIENEVLGCPIIRDEKKSCPETTCETYFICKKLFDLESVKDIIKENE